MPFPERATTTVSTEGRITLPKGMREALRWNAGTPLAVVVMDGGVLLKHVAVFAETSPEDVFGCLAFDGAAKSIEELDDGVQREARHRHSGD